MIGILISLAARLGVPEPLRKAAGIAGAVVALLALLSLARCAYDRSVIAGHEAERAARVERQARAAEHRADAAVDPIEQQIAAEAAGREGAIRNAAQAHPQEVRRPVGPATDAVVERLRRRAP